MEEFQVVAARIIKDLAAAGGQFSANELRDRLPEGVEPPTGRSVAQAFNAAAKLGLIERVTGVTVRATNPKAKGSPVSVWTGTAKALAPIVVSVPREVVSQIRQVTLLPIVETSGPVTTVDVASWLAPEGMSPELAALVRERTFTEDVIVKPCAPVPCPVSTESDAEYALRRYGTTDVIDATVPVEVETALAQPLAPVTDAEKAALAAAVASIRARDAAGISDEDSWDVPVPSVEPVTETVIEYVEVPVADPEREKIIKLQQKELLRLSLLVDELRETNREQAVLTERRLAVLTGRHAQAGRVLQGWLAKPKLGREVPRDQVNALVAGLVNALGVPTPRRAG